MKKIIIAIILTIITTNVSIPQYVVNRKDYRLINKNFNPQIKTFSLSDNLLSTGVAVIPNKSKFPISNFITDIFPFGDTTWFATGSGIMRTINRFNSFENFLGINPFGNEDISGLRVKNNVVVVATAISKEIAGDNVATGTGIKISTDYGNSWNAFPQPIDGRGDSSIVYGSNTLYALPVVVSEQNLSYDIEITRNQNDLNNYVIWISSFAGGLRKTTDYGNTWMRVLLPPDNLDSIKITETGYTFSLTPRSNLNHRVFSVEALNDSVLFVGTANGINKSTDWGISWKKFNFQNSGVGTNRVGGNFVVNFHVQKFSNKEIIWAATRKAEDLNEVNSVSFSSNGGINWAYTLKDSPPNNVSSKDSIVYAETDDGLWRAKFGLFDWSKPGLIYDEKTKDQIKTTNFYSGGSLNDTVYFGSGDGLIRTVENGQGWSGKWTIFRAQTEIDLNSNTKTYAAPNPFSPNVEVTRFFYKTNKTSVKVTIKIFDFGMNPLRTVIQNAVRSGLDQYYTIWDGKNDKGYQVANGVYFYRIELDDDKPVWGKVILLQ